MASKHARKHEARPLRVKKKVGGEGFLLDSNDFGFICAGVSSMGGYEKETPNII